MGVISLHNVVLGGNDHVENEQDHPLVKERQVFENILDNLFKQPESEKIAVRMEEVKEALGYNEAALAYYRT